ncbi:hypothetical protein [Prevotella sp. HUN102]|nr:hypothetical protein [Prevotella sp. HUN102]
MTPGKRAKNAQRLYEKRKATMRRMECVCAKNGTPIHPKRKTNRG